MPASTNPLSARPDQLRLTVARGAGAVVVSAHGELDLATVDLLTTTLHAAARAAEDVVIDAAGLTFVDGAGLRAMLAPLAADPAVPVRVRNPSRPVLRLLSLLDRLDVLEPPCPDGGVRSSALLPRHDTSRLGRVFSLADQP